MDILFAGLLVALLALIGIVTFQRRRASGNKGTHEAPWAGVTPHPDNHG